MSFKNLKILFQTSSVFLLLLAYFFLFPTHSFAQTSQKLGGFFSIKSDAVYFASHIIEKADSNSFQYLAIGNGGSEISFFGKDDAFTYFRETVIGESSDFSAVLHPNCIQHKSNFFSCFTRDPKTKTISTHKQAIIGTLQVRGDYVLDDERMYHINTSKFSVLDHDPEEINFYNDYYFQKKNKVFYGPVQIHAAHAKSFTLYEGEENVKFAKDRKYVYNSGRIIPNTTSKVFDISTYKNEGVIIEGTLMTESELYKSLKSFPRAFPFLHGFEQISEGKIELFLSSIFGFDNYGAQYSISDMGGIIHELMIFFTQAWMYIIIAIHILFHRIFSERDYIYTHQSILCCAGAIVFFHLFFQTIFLISGLAFGIALQYFFVYIFIYIISQFILESDRGIGIWLLAYPLLNLALYIISIIIYVSISLFLL